MTDFCEKKVIVMTDFVFLVSVFGKLRWYGG